MRMPRPTSLIMFLLLLLAAALLASGCGSDDGGSGDGDAGDSAAETEASDEEGSDEECTEAGEVEMPDDLAEREDMYDAPPCRELDPDTTYTVTVTTSEGTFDITLDQEAGPTAAANFAFLVEEGFYDGVGFHRIIKDFMVQTGDPTGTGTGGPGYSIEDDEVDGSYDRGTVAMANAGPDTGGSQFFIVHGTGVDETLGKDYSIFGTVDDAGMKVVDKIASVKVTTSPNGEPSQPVKTVRIEKMELTES